MGLVKLLPFAAIAIVGLLFVDVQTLAPGDFNPSGEPLFASLAALAPLTMFAYLGLESATVPAGDVREPAKTIPRSTILGIGIAAAFGRLSVRGVPAFGIIVSAAFATVLVSIGVSGSPGFAAIYNLLVGLSTMAAVIPYAFCALAGPLVAARLRGGPVRRINATELVAFTFAVFTLYGCGAEPVLYGLILLVLGIPVYVWRQRRRAPDQTA